MIVKANIELLTLILITFSQKEIEIYRLRKFSDLTLEEIGKKYKVTRERIRQIEIKVEEKMQRLEIQLPDTRNAVERYRQQVRDEVVCLGKPEDVTVNRDEVLKILKYTQ